MFTKDEERCMNAIVEFDVTGDILTRLESQQTPVRIQGQRQAYYILSVDQLLTLLQPPMHFEDDTSFAPEDFGLTEDDVTAYLARRHCNAYKAAATEAVDPETGQMVRLFQPRLDNWSDHFERSRDWLLILGRTPIGRATVMRLHFNDPGEQRARAIHRDYLATLFPLD
jgi:hypothetical protein